MSASERLSVCGDCGNLHPVAGPCVQVDAARGTVRDAGSGHAGTLPAVEAVRLREETARLACERDQARAGLADAERLTRGLVSRLRDVASRIGPARQADDIRAALEEVLRGADCRDLPRDTALDEARQGRDALARELSRAQGDAADLARQRDEARRQVADWQRQRDEVLADLREARLTTHAALALLRRWQQWFRFGTATPPRQAENSGDIARDTDAILAAAAALRHAPGRDGHTACGLDAARDEADDVTTWDLATCPDCLRRRPTPATGPSRVSDGLLVRCQGCGRESSTLWDGRCRKCHDKRNGSSIVAVEVRHDGTHDCGGGPVG